MRTFPIATRLATAAAAGLFLGPALAADPAPQDYSGNAMHDLSAVAGEARRAAIADGYLRSAGPARAPAVSAVNGKFSVEGGAVGSQGGQSALGIAQGSITAPLGSSFGVQFDGGAATSHSAVLGGAGIQAFWRDPAVGLVGPVAAMISSPWARTGLYLGQAELYAGMFTLSAAAGYQDVANHGSGSAPSGGFWLGRLTVYPMPDLALSIEGRSSAGQASGRGILEFQPAHATVRNLSFIIHGAAGDSAYYSITAGIRFYFGADKPLIRRHREDDPMSAVETSNGGTWIPDGSVYINAGSIAWGSNTVVGGNGGFAAALARPPPPPLH